MKRRTKSLIVLVLMFISSMGVFLWLEYQGSSGANTDQAYLTGANALETTYLNYHDEVMVLSDEYQLSYAYLMALITLECSGNKPPGSRFEPAVFRRLMQVRDGDRGRYENIRPSHLKDASEEALRNLATSWGPFQLMGYKCIGLDVNVRDIRGEEGVDYGVKWISEEYGHLLKKDRFKDAFHYHNTGRTYPKVGKPRTHDPNYVGKGLTYMAYFDQRRLEE